MYHKIINTDNYNTTILIRIMVGSVFLTEGIQKFIYPSTRGVGRFESMGFPAPEVFGNFVAYLKFLAAC
ncbi:MAG: DoxX family protein [Balneolales bacterium]